LEKHTETLAQTGTREMIHMQTVGMHQSRSVDSFADSGKICIKLFTITIT